MRLEDMAFVRSGLVLGRKQSKTKTEYCYPLLNLRCVNPDGYIDEELCEVFYSVEPLNPEYLTHKGDVVIRLTVPYTAVLITENLEGYVIPSSFVVARVDYSKLLPEYLLWMINSQVTKKQIYEDAVSNMLGAVKPRYFAEFDIEDLPLHKQRIVAELSYLAQKEKRLLAELATEKEKYYDYVINQAYKEMKRGN